jgi:hypothetical protein
MRRSVLYVVVLSLLLAVSASAAPSGERRLQLRREIGDPIARIIRVVKKTIRSLGDGITTPRP